MKKLGLFFLILFLVASICFVAYRLIYHAGGVAGGDKSFGFQHVVIYILYGGGAVVGVLAVIAIVRSVLGKDKES